jgi:hypothetical protein
MSDYCTTEEAIAYLKIGMPKFTKNDLYTLIDNGLLSPYFHFSGELIVPYVASEVPQCNGTYFVHTLKKTIKYTGYVSPSDTVDANCLVKLSPHDSVRVQTVNNIDPEKSVVLKDEVDNLVASFTSTEKLNFATVYTICRNGNSLNQVKNHEIHLSKNDCYFSKAQLEMHLLAPIPADQPKHVVTLQEHEKVSLVVIATLLEFILRKVLIKIKTNEFKADVIRSQSDLVKKLDALYSPTVKNMSKSRLNKTFADANAFVEKGEYPDKNNEGANRIIISSLLNFILTRVTLSTRAHEILTIENQDQLVEKLVSISNNKITKHIFTAKLKDIENDNSLKNNK